MLLFTLCVRLVPLSAFSLLDITSVAALHIESKIEVREEQAMTMKEHYTIHTRTMNQLMTLLILIAVMAAGCATSNHSRNLTSGQALALAQSKLPAPDIGQAYGVSFNNGTWLICLCSASFIANGPQGIVVAKVNDIDGKVEVFARLPSSMEKMSGNTNDWIRQTVPSKART